MACMKVFLAIISVTLATAPALASTDGLSFVQMHFNKADRDDTALGVRSAGYPCEDVERVDKVFQNNKELPIFRVYCGNVTFQGTVMNGRLYFKPWTGNIVGR